MRISIANVSEKVGDVEFRSVVHAIERQVHEDFAPVWGMDATIRLASVRRDRKPNPEINLGDAVIYVGETNDDAQQVADAVGYHDQNHKGIPFGFVFTDVARQIGEEWSTTLSHEVLELVVDPDVNLLVLGPHPKNPSVQVLRSYEVSDPTQADTYKIDGVEVSNFVTPLYFANLPHPTHTQTNHLNLPLERFGCRPGGYVSFFNFKTMQWEETYGDERVGKERVATKSKASRFRRRRGQQL